jgi:enamine deaminase RidA (YjgF/YER057c/UK114 family)
MQKLHIPLGARGAAIGMSAAVRYGNLIAVSGQLSSGEKGEVLNEGDFLAQAEQCFANIERILAQAGATLSDVVALNTFLTDRENAMAFLKLRGRLFPERPPATTTVIAQLINPLYLIEIQAWAAVDG